MIPEEKIIEDLKINGWHLINVLGESQPDYSYTIGLYKKFKFNEILISGLNGVVAHSIISEIVANLKSDIRITPEEISDDIFNGFPCYSGIVDKTYYDKYFGKAVWFYGGHNFSMIQCVWPNKQKLFPWETDQPFHQEILFTPPIVS